MVKYVLKRIVYAALTLFFLTLLTFIMMHALPGDPFVGDKAINPKTMEALYAKYGLDKPIWQQFFMYVGNMLRGDLGISIKYNRPVTGIIAEAFPYSADLGIRSLIIATVFGLTLGTVAALKRNTAMDTATMTLAVLGVSIPSFVVGALMQYVFSIKFRQWFGWGLPVMGWHNEWAKLMPAIALSFSSMATIARLMRTSTLDVLGQDYIKTAKAKGLSQSGIVKRHTMRNAILPVITVLGPLVAALLTGAFVVENIFNIPGMGKFFVLAIKEQDYTLIAGTTVFYGMFLVGASLIVDILYGFIDPRIKLADQEE